jgi:hypothetical protein
LSTVLAGTTTVGNVTALMEDEPVKSPTVDTKEEPAPSPTVTVTKDDEDDTLSYFEKLAEGS